MFARKLGSVRWLQFVGVALLFGAALVYMLAVDRAWYAVDGPIRSAAESHGLLRWRFVSHALAMWNGGMRDQSWAFVAFPILFWGGVVTFLVGVIAVGRQRSNDRRLRCAAEMLRGRVASPVDARHRLLGSTKATVAAGLVLALVSLAMLRGAPSRKELTKAQSDAGALRMRLDQMSEGQRLMAAEDSVAVGSFGDVLSMSEAEALVRKAAAERHRFEIETKRRCATARAPGECLLLAQGSAMMRRTLVALTKSEVAERTEVRLKMWREVLEDLDLATIIGGALALAAFILLGIAAVRAPRVIGTEFRGNDPSTEDSLYPVYSRLASVLTAVTVLVVIIGVAFISGEQPDGIAVTILTSTFSWSLALIASVRTLSAPRTLARVRDPQLAATGAIAAHDQAVQADLAKHEANANAKQQYVATLQAAAAPAQLVAQAEAEAADAMMAAQHARGRLLGGALSTARKRLKAAIAQQHALRTHPAPPEAFVAVDAVASAARAEIVGLVAAAGWAPWPPTENETPQMLRSESASRYVLVVGGFIAALVGCIAVLSRPNLHSESRATDATQAVGPHPDCAQMLDQYQGALIAARDSADAVGSGSCASDDGQGHLIPLAQLTPECDARWKRHVVNAQHVVDLNSRVRTACPGTDIASLGEVPTRLRIGSSSSDPWADSNRGELPRHDASSGANTRPTTSTDALTIEAVHTTVRAQATALSRSSNEFANTFADDAIVWLPDALDLLKGPQEIAAGTQRAWGIGATVEVSGPVVELGFEAAVATSTWKVRLATGEIQGVRVTEVLAATADGPRVIAAHFSVPSSATEKSINEPVPRIPVGSRPIEPEVRLLRPLELSRLVGKRETVIVLGSEPTEFALGPKDAHALLASWKNVKLDFVGDLHVLDKGDIRIAAGYARWPRKSTLFRVLAVFVAAEVQGLDSSPMAWEVITAHYSVVPDRRAR